MSSTASAAGGDVLPALPPIRTASPLGADQDARPSPADSSSSTAEPRPEEEAGSQQEAAEPTTPTWEESRLQPPTECPPAPRKQAWAPPPAPAAKRKFPTPTPATAAARRPAFFPVARDLSAVFRPLPPKKRIRAG